MNITKTIVAAVAVLAAGAVFAQSYPVKPIRLVVPFPPGGPADSVARVLAQKLTEVIGQNVVVDNRAGATGTIGAGLVAKSPPDGYTLLLGTSNELAMSPGLFDKLPYDPVKDFAPVSQGTYYGYVLIVHPSVAAKSVQELVALAKTKPLSYGTAGAGSANHLAGEFLAAMTSIKLTPVPYKGSVVALADVMGGQIPMMFDTPITTLPQLKAGKVRALAFSGKRRMQQIAEVATMEELGYKGFEVSSWQGVITTAGSPKVAVDRLHQETVKALKMPDVIERLATQGGNELVGSTPAEYAQLIKDEIVKYAKIIKEAGIKVE